MAGAGVYARLVRIQTQIAPETSGAQQPEFRLRALGNPGGLSHEAQSA
jgi:hypothetical protein